MKIRKKHKNLCHKKIKFQDNKNCSEAAQLENKTDNLEKNETDVDNLKYFIKNNKLISKTQQNLKSERHKVFTEEINKIALSLNDDTRVQSIESTETYVDRTSKV